MKKLPDNEACRRYLIGQKKYQKNYIKHIKISDPIFKVNGKRLSLYVNVTYNLRTDRMSVCCDFHYSGKPMLARKIVKIKCNTESGRRFIKEHRKTMAKSVSNYYHRKIRKFV